LIDTNKKSEPDSFLSDPDFLKYSGLLLLIMVIEFTIQLLTLKRTYIYRRTIKQKSRPWRGRLYFKFTYDPFRVG